MRAFIALGFTAALAACGGSAASVDDALARDLAQVGSASAFELAPATSGTQVMSAIELGRKAPTATPAPSPERKPVARVASTPKRAQAPVPKAAPRAVAQAPVPVPEVVAENAAPQPAPAAAPAPTSAPLGAGPAPPGGWRSVGDVIRNSRIPITP